jgi:phosphoribosylformylglycinamidine synthase
MLPGALVTNAGLRFLSHPVTVRVEAVDTPCTSAYEPGATLTLPIAHGQGRYVAPDDVLRELEAEGRVVLRYMGDNPNGSMNAIAGIANRQRNVVGMMPHPERAASAEVGESAGRGVFASLTRTSPVFGGGVR